MKKLTPSDKEIIKDLAVLLLVWAVSVGLVVVFLRNFGVI